MVEIMLTEQIWASASWLFYLFNLLALVYDTRYDIFRLCRSPREEASSL